MIMNGTILIPAFNPGFQHFFQLDDDSYYCLLLFRLIYVNTVLVMNRNHPFANSCDRLILLVHEVEGKSDDIAPQLPSEPLDIRDIPDHMKNII